MWLKYLPIFSVLRTPATGYNMGYYIGKVVYKEQYDGITFITFSFIWDQDKETRVDHLLGWILFILTFGC